MSIKVGINGFGRIGRNIFGHSVKIPRLPILKSLVSTISPMLPPLPI